MAELFGPFERIAFHTKVFMLSYLRICSYEHWNLEAIACVAEVDLSPKPLSN